jgi:hypothetical protein
MKRALAVLILGIAISGCQPEKQIVAEPELTATGTPTLPHASSSLSVYASPVPRWMQYQTALSGVFVPKPYMSGDGFCEWEIIGQAAGEVYVWAICQDKKSDAAMSAPAVITIGHDGAIGNVIVPDDGSNYTKDIKRLFPPALQERILSHNFNVEDMWDHIQLRRHQGGEPLIALSNIGLP